jgi:hypothetical protein
MEVSGQLKAPAALFLGKERPLPIDYETGWASEQVWTTWRSENSCPSPGTQTPTVQPVARRYTDYAIPALYITFYSF